MARFVTRLRAARSSNEGFTLIEVVVAMTVLFGALASLAYVGTFALTDVGVSRERETATGLVNQAIEQVRALPYDTVKKGLSTTDLAAGGDSTITSSGGTYSYNGEQIPTASGLSNYAPIVPHKNTVAIDGHNYTVAAYVTYYNGDSTSGAFRVTVIVSWTSGLRSGIAAKSVSAQTVVYAGTSSGGGSSCTLTCPYQGVKQPNFYASSTSAPGGITFTPGTSASELFDDLETATLAISHRTSNMSIEQTWAVQSNFTLGGISYRRTNDTSDTVLGESTGSASSDNDTTSGSRPEYSTGTAGPQAAASIAFSNSYGDALTFAIAAGPNGTAIGTTNASATNACPNAANPAVNQLTSLPCGNANTNTTTASGTGVLSAALSIGTHTGVTGGTANVVQITPANGSAAHVVRANTPNVATSCASVTASTDGCVGAVHRRSIGSVYIGGIPSLSVAGVPIGIPAAYDYLIKATALETTIKSEAGVGATQTAPTRTGTLQVWNGVGYTTVTMSSGASISVTPVSLTLGTTSVTISATLRNGTIPTSAPSCSSTCTSSSVTAESTLVGDVSYKIVVGGVTVINTTMHIDFGTLSVSTLYTPST